MVKGWPTQLGKKVYTFLEWWPTQPKKKIAPFAHYETYGK